MSLQVGSVAELPNKLRVGIATNVRSLILNLVVALDHRSRNDIVTEIDFMVIHIFCTKVSR